MSRVAQLAAVPNNCQISAMKVLLKRAEVAKDRAALKFYQDLYVNPMTH